MKRLWLRRTAERFGQRRFWSGIVKLKFVEQGPKYQRDQNDGNRRNKELNSAANDLWPKKLSLACVLEDRRLKQKELGRHQHQESISDQHLPNCGLARRIADVKSNE